MRIAYVITRSDSIGGAHIHVRDLAGELLRLGHEVTVLVGGEGPFTQELSRLGIPFRALTHLTRPIHPWHDALALGELIGTLRELAPDLISTHSSKAGWLGRAAGRLLGIPTLFTAHGWAFTEGPAPLARRVYAVAERIAAPLATRLITVSEYDRQIALQHRVAPPEKLVAIHNGMPDVETSLRADPRRTPPRVVTVARFESQKDYDTLLRALAGLTDLAWEADLIGEGPLRPAFEALALELGLGERVRFLGARRDVAELLQAAQVFVLISKWEGLPRSIIEALRAGLPVVASDVGGVAEEIVPGENGYLVPRGGVNETRERLGRLLSDPDLRQKMGAQGRRTYENDFTFAQMFSRTLAVYHEAAEGRGRS